jgi:TM2 domain-containing membrane protein YozV
MEDRYMGISTVLRGIAALGTLIGLILLLIPDVEWVYRTYVWVLVSTILWFIPSETKRGGAGISSEDNKNEGGLQEAEK